MLRVVGKGERKGERGHLSFRGKAKGQAKGDISHFGRRALRTRLPLGPGCVKLSGARARVSLTVSVRNEEENLAAALGFAAGLFDEIVVVDKRSTDRTLEITREFGDRVFEFVSVAGFAVARNAALARASGDYAFWLDADDVVDPPQRERLQELFTGLNGHEQAADVIRCSCDPEPNGNDGQIRQRQLDHIRRFGVNFHCPDPASNHRAGSDEL
jgi:glycosyltransferase involved in cell wall biosynthesis